jgi:hypothetical protein
VIRKFLRRGLIFLATNDGLWASSYIEGSSARLAGVVLLEAADFSRLPVIPTSGFRKSSAASKLRQRFAVPAAELII